jgi:hypothetical protein
MAYPKKDVRNQALVELRNSNPQFWGWGRLALVFGIAKGNARQRDLKWAPYYAAVDNLQKKTIDKG